MNTQALKLFIINLKKDAERKEYMEELCIRHALHPEFIEAVYGKNLSQSEVDNVYNIETIMRTFGRELSRGEIGVFLSHRHILERIVKERIDQAMVFEDDISFDTDLVEILSRKEHFPSDWELILFGHHPEESRVKDSEPSFWFQKKLYGKYFISRPCERAMGAYAYMINLKGAERLLNNLNLITEPIDHFTGDSQYVNLYTIHPAPVRIYETLSDLSDNMGEREMLKERKNPQADSSYPLLKKVAKWFGIYSTVRFLRNYLKRLRCMVRPLSKYH